MLKEKSPKLGHIKLSHIKLNPCLSFEKFQKIGEGGGEAFHF